MKEIRKGDAVTIQLRDLDNGGYHEPFDAIITAIKRKIWFSVKDDNLLDPMRIVHYERLENQVRSYCSEEFITTVLPQVAGEAPIIECIEGQRL